jgi:hypothetical protein
MDVPAVARTDAALSRKDESSPRTLFGAVRIIDHKLCTQPCARAEGGAVDPGGCTAGCSRRLAVRSSAAPARRLDRASPTRPNRVATSPFPGPRDPTGSLGKSEHTARWKRQRESRSAPLTALLACELHVQTASLAPQLAF